MTSKSSITTDPDWIENDHAGAILTSEFLEPGGISVDVLAKAIAMSAEQLREIVDGRRPMDAGTDLRLGRYFGMSEGFFLGLQDRYELIEAKRALNGELDRIEPRAARYSVRGASQPAATTACDRSAQRTLLYTLR